MNPIEQLIPGREKDLGGFTVRRLLPYAARRMVGPFIFLDHMGPAAFAAGDGIDVRPHPHIGLATVTYLFAGEIVHRDTLGSLQAITPGAVNWMTAGRGIAHSERTGTDERGRPHAVHGLQSWIALPRSHEECAPEFFHHPASSLPELQLPGVTLRVIAGTAYGVTAPVKTYSPLFYVEARMEAGATLDLPLEAVERGVYPIDGTVALDGTALAAHTLAVVAPGEVTMTAHTSAHLMLLGGDPFPEPRYIEWNFVSSRPERIAQAKDDWRNGRFGTVPGDEREFIPLPAEPKPGTIL